MASLMLVNPRKRKASKKRRKNPIAKRASHHARKPIAHKKHRRYRRNPIESSGIVSQVKSASIGAAGALAVDVILAKVGKNLPLSMQSGAALNLAQGVISLGIGIAVAKLGKNKKLGMELANGGLTVALYNAARTTIGKSVGLADDLLGYDMSGAEPNLLGVDDYMGDYDEQNDMAGDDDEAWLSPAPLSGYNY